MNGYTLAVFSDSSDYIHRFLAYCREHDTPFDVSGFTDLQVLKSHLKICSIDILLLPRDFVRTEFVSIERDKMIGTIVYLGERQDLESSPKEINMYRPMGNILSDLKAIAATLDQNRPAASSDTDITGIFVLDGNAEAGDFASMLADSPERSGEQILFIDLDRFSGFALRHGLAPSGTLSDLIFCFMMGSASLPDILKKCAVQAGNLHYVSPPVAGNDPDEIPYTQWRAFITTLADTGGYSQVFINLRSNCRNFLHMFGTCRKIYLFSSAYHTAVSGIPCAEYGGFRAMAFHEYFSLNERPDILHKTEDGYAAAEALADILRNAPVKGRKFKDKWKKVT